MAIVTKTIAEVPAIDALAADDEMLVRDTSKGESARVTMQELADFVGGGGGDASTWSQYPATQDVDMDGNKITGLGAPTDAADAATKQYVDTVAGAAPTKIENGTASLEVTPGDGGSSIARLVRNGFEYLLLNDEWFNSGSGWFGRRTLPASTPSNSHSWFEFGNAHALMKSNFTGGSTFGAVRVDTANGGNVYFDIPGASAGGGYDSSKGIRLGSHISHTPNVRALPSNVNSILHGIKLGVDAHDTLASMPAPPELEWWEPVWTPVSNVDSVSNVECQYTRTYRASGGSLVTLEGTITVEIDEDDEPTILSAPLPVPATSTGTLAGLAISVDISRGDRADCRASITDLGSGPVLVIAAGELANATGVPATLTIGFRVSYRAS